MWQLNKYKDADQDGTDAGVNVKPGQKDKIKKAVDHSEFNYQSGHISVLAPTFIPFFPFPLLHDLLLATFQGRLFANSPIPYIFFQSILQNATR